MGVDDGEMWGLMQAELRQLRGRVAVLTEELDAAQRREQIADEARQIVGRWFNEQTTRVAVLEAGLRDASAALAIAARHAETTGAAPIIVSVARDAHHAARALLQSEPGSAGGVPAAAPEPDAWVEYVRERIGQIECPTCGSTDRAERSYRLPQGLCRDAWHDGETPL